MKVRCRRCKCVGFVGAVLIAVLLLAAAVDVGVVALVLVPAAAVYFCASRSSARSYCGASSRARPSARVSIRATKN